MQVNAARREKVVLICSGPPHSFTGKLMRTQAVHISTDLHISKICLSRLGQRKQMVACFLAGIETHVLMRQYRMATLQFRHGKVEYDTGNMFRVHHVLSTCSIGMLLVSFISFARRNHVRATRHCTKIKQIGSADPSRWRVCS